MKKILVIAFTFLLVSCNNDSLEKNIDEQIEETSMARENFELVNSFEKELSGTITLKIDPKIESTYLIAHLLSDKTGYEVYFDEDDYIVNQVERFSKYKNHEVFSILEGMIKQGFTYNAISGVLHYYTDELELVDGIKPNEKIMRRAGGQGQVEEYLRALYDFRKVSKYDEYFLKNDQYFETILNRAKKHIENSNMEQVYLDYYGESLGNLIIVITPTCPMGFGNRIEIENQKVLMPTLQVSMNEENYISFLLHEISHSYVNTETDLRLKKVDVLKTLFEPIRSSMTKQSYPKWKICLNEHIVRGNVILMLEEIYGELTSENRLNYDEERDFIYLKNVLNSLDVYKESREEYPKFRMYYDLILDHLSSEL